MMPVGDQACPFCEIIAGRGRATILREWTDVTAIAPLNPAVEGHALIIPHEHLERPDLGYSGDQVPMPWPHPGDRPEHHD
jgi:histidine triad (HIT) family protein